MEDVEQYSLERSVVRATLFSVKAVNSNSILFTLQGFVFCFGAFFLKPFSCLFVFIFLNLPAMQAFSLGLPEG